MTSAKTLSEQILMAVAALALSACAGPDPQATTAASHEPLAPAAVMQVGQAERVDVKGAEVLDVRTRTDHLAGMGLPVAHPYKDGDLCTVDARTWAAPCEAGAPAGCLLRDTFGSLYAGDFAIGWEALTVRFTRVDWLVKALPGGSAPAMLAKALVDPEAQQLNQLAAETIALRLSVDLNTQGLMGNESLAEALLVVGPLAGLTISEVLELAEQAVGGFPDKMERRGLNVDTLTLELGWLNTLSPKCEVNTAFMRL